MSKIELEIRCFLKIIIIVLFSSNHDKLFSQDTTGIIVACGLDSTLQLSNSPNVDSTSFHECGFEYKKAAFFDVGSYSTFNKPLYFKVKRVQDAAIYDGNGRFDDFAYFNCDDVGKTLTIILRVFDAKPDSGHVEDNYLPNVLNAHYKDCEYSFTVLDNTAPTIRCPADISINCSKYNFEYPLKNNDLNYFTDKFGKVIIQDCFKNNYSSSFNYINQNNQSAVALNGVAFDICYVKTVQNITHEFNCGDGIIHRNFYAIDSAGNKSMTCIQNIYVKNDQPITVNPFVYKDPGNINKPCDGQLRIRLGQNENFVNDPYYSLDSIVSIIWPDKVVEITDCNNLDTIGTSCEWTGRDAGSPIIIGNDFCNPVFITFTDEIFPNETNVCKKILRKWEVHDTCRAKDTSWTYFQVIKVINKVGPVFKMGCNNDTLCSFPNDCSPVFAMTCALAEDYCSIKNNVKYGFQIDYNSDGNIDQIGSDSCAMLIDKNLYSGIHTINWFAEDKCGNISSCQKLVKVIECTKPNVVAKTISLDLSADSCYAILEANKLNQNSTDNCTPPNELRFKVVKEKDFNINFTKQEVELFSDKMRFSDTNVGPNFVYLIALDNYSNWSYSKTLAIINNTNNCITPDSTTSIITIKNEFGQQIDGVDIYKDDSIWYPKSVGLRPFVIKDTLIHKISLQKNYETRNGVTTADLVAINKHILKVDTLKSNYNRIAADINNDKKIATSDMIELRKIILFIQDDFSKNSSWKFIDKLYPFFTSIPESENYQQYLYNNKFKLNYDFVGVKIGDVNNSAKLNFQNNNLLERSVHQIQIEDKPINSNENIEVILDFERISELNGIQLSLSFDNEALEFVNTNIDIDSYNEILTKEGFFVASILQEELPSKMIKLYFKCKKSGLLSEYFQQNNNLLQNEFYQNDNIAIPLGIQISETIKTTKLYQNRPNPFTNETIIPFYIAKEGNVLLTIFDINGKIVKQFKDVFPKGKQEIHVQNIDLEQNGIYYYQLKTEESEAIMKMIKLN